MRDLCLSRGLGDVYEREGLGLGLGLGFILGLGLGFILGLGFRFGVELLGLG